MIYSINKNETVDIHRVAISSKGTKLDLTAAVITISAKQFGDASTTLFTKASSDTSQIEILTPKTKGLFVVKLLAADTSTLNYKSIYCQESIVIGSKTYTDTFFLKLKGITTGIPIETFVVSPKKKVIWTMINGNTPARILKTGFSGTVTAAVAGNRVTLTSSAEFGANGIPESNDESMTIVSANTSTIVLDFDDVTTHTISFWWEDPTQINISNSGYAIDPAITINSNIQSGTSIQRLASTPTANQLWVDTTDETIYAYINGAWV